MSLAFYIRFPSNHRHQSVAMEQFKDICSKNIVSNFKAVKKHKTSTKMNLVNYDQTPKNAFESYYKECTFLEVSIQPNANVDDHELMQEIYDEFCFFIITSNLAIPAILDVSEKTEFYYEGQSFSWGQRFTHDIFEFSTDYKNYFSQHISPLCILQTWNWAQTIPGFNDGTLSKTNVGRALCAFSNFFDLSPQYYFPQYFIWSMIGLEALFADGSQSVGYQIREKAKVLFKLSDSDIKTINKLYNFRSRFFHGQTNFYNPHAAYSEHLDRNKDLIKYNDEEIEFMYFSFRLFLATLQYCAKHQLTSLEFEYMQKKP